MIKRIIARLDIKNNFLVKGMNLEGLRILGYPELFSKKYFDEGIDEIIFQDVVASLYKRNQLSHLTSKISDIKNLEKLEINKMIRDSEKELNNENIEDGTRYLINQKLDTLRSLSLN